MNKIASGYYTINRKGDEEVATVARVDDGNNEVDIMGFTPGYTRQQVFGNNANFIVLSGPWELPQ